MSNRSLYKALRHINDVIPDPADGLLLQIQRLVSEAIAEEMKDRQLCISVDCSEGGSFFIPIRWMSLDHIYWFNKKNPEIKFTTFAGARFVDLESLMGYPAKTYHFPDELIMDDFKIRSIIHPKGAIGLGKRWYYQKVEDPQRWFDTVARPHYAQLYRDAKKQTQKQSIQSLVEMVKEDIENGTFPFKEPQ